MHFLIEWPPLLSFLEMIKNAFNLYQQNIIYNATMDHSNRRGGHREGCFTCIWDCGCQWFLWPAKWCFVVMCWQSIVSLHEIKKIEAILSKGAQHQRTVRWDCSAASVKTWRCHYFNQIKVKLPYGKRIRNFNNAPLICRCFITLSPN